MGLIDYVGRIPRTGRHFPAGVNRNTDSGNGGIVGRTAQKSGDIRRWDGPAEEVALSLGASVGLEIGQLSGVLDAFGSGCQAKSFCKAKDRADDHLAVFALVEARDKAAINLDLIEVK